MKQRAVIEFLAAEGETPINSTAVKLNLLK